MTIYRRRPTESWEELAAAATGLLVGVAVFYLIRLWLQREPLPGGEEAEARGTEARGTEARGTEARGTEARGTATGRERGGAAPANSTESSPETPQGGSERP